MLTNPPIKVPHHMKHIAGSGRSNLVDTCDADCVHAAGIGTGTAYESLSTGKTASHDHIAADTAVATTPSLHILGFLFLSLRCAPSLPPRALKLRNRLSDCSAYKYCSAPTVHLHSRMWTEPPRPPAHERALISVIGCTHTHAHRAFDV